MKIETRLRGSKGDASRYLSTHIGEAGEFPIKDDSFFKHPVRFLNFYLKQVNSEIGLREKIKITFD